jgi:hypothetical protein
VAAEAKDSETGFEFVAARTTDSDLRVDRSQRVRSLSLEPCVAHNPEKQPSAPNRKSVARAGRACLAPCCPPRPPRPGPQRERAEPCVPAG